MDRSNYPVKLQFTRRNIFTVTLRRLRNSIRQFRVSIDHVSVHLKSIFADVFFNYISGGKHSATRRLESVENNRNLIRRIDSSQSFQIKSPF